MLRVLRVCQCVYVYVSVSLYVCVWLSLRVRICHGCRPGVSSDTPHRFLPSLPPAITALNLRHTKFTLKQLELLGRRTSLRHITIDIAKGCKCAYNVLYYAE